MENQRVMILQHTSGLKLLASLDRRRQTTHTPHTSTVNKKIMGFHCTVKIFHPVCHSSRSQLVGSKMMLKCTYLLLLPLFITNVAAFKSIKK